jgi:hypothetical protein
MEIPDMKPRTLFAFALVLLTSVPSTALANKIQKLNIGPLDGYAGAPTIEVYSTDGEQWNAIDKTKAVKFKITLNAECKFEGKGNKAYEGDMTVAGFDIIGDTEPADFLIPHSGTAEASFRFVDGADQPVKPIEVCSTELTKRLSQDKNLTKYHVLSKGFTVNYAGAFNVKYRMYCRATGLGKTDYGSDTTLVNAKIHCAASDLAKARVPKPPPRAELKPARLIQLVKAVSFEADPATYTGKCPVGIQFDGSITASRAGTVKYRYVSHDNRKSPEFTLEFKAAGSQPTREWHRTLSKPEAGGRLAAAPGASTWDHQGWYRLDVLEPTGVKSTTTNYKVSCQEPKPARMIKIEPN